MICVFHQSLQHSWHVHVNPEGGDTYAEMGKRCKSLGGHYNPYGVDLAVSIVIQHARGRSHGTGRIFNWLKNLRGHLVTPNHSFRSHRSSAEPVWILTERCFNKCKMAPRVTPLPYKNLVGADVKFSTKSATDLTSILAFKFLNRWAF